MIIDPLELVLLLLLESSCSAAGYIGRMCFDARRRRRAGRADVDAPGPRPEGGRLYIEETREIPFSEEDQGGEIVFIASLLFFFLETARAPSSIARGTL